MSPSKKPTKASGKSDPTESKRPSGFTEEERSAMRDYVKEKRLEAAGGNEESAVLDKIAQMAEPDRTMAKRVHAIVKSSAPALLPRLWYGMPAYAIGGKVVCFFQPAQKFKTRYSTLGFSDKANLDEGEMWPCAYALKSLTSGEEAKIAALVKRAAS